MRSTNIDSQSCPKPKWFGLINDTVIPAPQQRVPATVLRTQAGIPTDHALFRDHNSPHDVLIHADADIDLAQGNVFYSRSDQCEQRENSCENPAKLAWAVDDRAEITLRPAQTGQSVRELFGLDVDIVLLRDFESPIDQTITDADPVAFGEGPVFITRKAHRYCIIIEEKTYPWNEPRISTAQIRELGHLPADQSVVIEDAEGHERTLREDEVIELQPGCRVGRAPKYKRG